MCPWLLLKANGIEFEEIQIALYEDNSAENLGPYSPSLKVPVLLHNGATVWDSLSICEYISEQLLAGRGWPVNPRNRASARSISAEVHSSFANLKKDWPMNCKISVDLFVSGKLADEIARIDAIWSCSRRKYGQEGDYLFGRFCIADCMFAPMAVCFHSYGAPLSLIAQRYVDTLMTNPYVSRWVKLARKEEETFPIKNVINL